MSKKIPQMIFKTQNKTYRVIKKEWGQKEFDKDLAYVMSEVNPYVFPYRGKVEDLDHAHQVGLYTIKKHGKKITFYVLPKTKEDKALYSKNRIIMLSSQSIFEKLKDDINEIPTITVTEGDIFQPQLSHEDDIALAIMKYSIAKKLIDFNSYTNRFASVATKNNGRRALTEGHTLKMEMASRFCEVFDLEMAIVCWDKKGCANPMCKNGEKVVNVIFNEDEIDLTDPNIKFERVERKNM